MLADVYGKTNRLGDGFSNPERHRHGSNRRGSRERDHIEVYSSTTYLCCFTYKIKASQVQLELRTQCLIIASKRMAGIHRDIRPPQAKGQMFRGNKAQSRLSPALQLRGRCICCPLPPSPPPNPPSQPYGPQPLKCVHAKQNAEQAYSPKKKKKTKAQTSNMWQRRAVNKPATCLPN